METHSQRRRERRARRMRKQPAGADRGGCTNPSSPPQDTPLENSLLQLKKEIDKGGDEKTA